MYDDGGNYYINVAVKIEKENENYNKKNHL